MDPEDESYLLNERAVELCRQGNYQEALPILLRAIELDSDNIDAWYSKASCLYCLSRLSEALESYRQVLKIDPDDDKAKKWCLRIETELGDKTSKNLAPVYAVIFEEDRQPTNSEVSHAILFFVNAGNLEKPSANSRIAYFYGIDMSRETIDSKFMVTVGRQLLKYFPDLARYIRISQTEFESPDLDIDIVGTETQTGYVRVMYIKEI
jgi:tetratricopeptide (TPR) repeat protein